MFRHEHRRTSDNRDSDRDSLFAQASKAKTYRGQTGKKRNEMKSSVL
jgi:hypothetical protein